MEPDFVFNVISKKVTWTSLTLYGIQLYERHLTIEELFPKKLSKQKYIQQKILPFT